MKHISAKRKSKTIISPSKFTINIRSLFLQYIGSFTLALVLFTILSIYLFFRRGYYDLYIANKIFAGVSAILLGIILLLGPLGRLFSFVDRYVRYRKEIGITAFFLAFTHGMVSLFFLPSKFPLSKFLTPINWPFVFGFCAFILLIIIFSVSNQFSMNLIGRKTWWRLQYLGIRFVFVLIFLHVFIMKWNGWFNWYKNGGGKELVRPEWPGAGLLVGWFILFVFIFRLSGFISQKLEKIIWFTGICILPLIYAFTFWWGQQLLK